MNTNAALQVLEALKQEQEQLPSAIKTAVQRTQRAEVRRLQARETELTDLVADAELALIDAQIAALPNQAALDQALRQAEAAMRQAEREHVAAVQKLIACQEVWRAAFSLSLSNDMQRDKLTLERQELALRAMPADVGALFDVTGHRLGGATLKA